VSIKLEIIDPLNYPTWDELLLSNDEYSFFQTSHWAGVLHGAYHFKPCYFSLIHGNRLVALIPLMEINSILTGKRGVSLPFTDYCEPIVSREIETKVVFDFIKEYALKAGWKYIEFRGAGRLFQDSPPHASWYYKHTLKLKRDEDQLFSSFKGNTQRNIRRAATVGLEVRIDNSFDALMEFYRLNCMTREEHGLPPQPFYFFRKVYDHVISMDHGFVSLAFHDGKAIAGAVYFHFGGRAIYKYGASDKAYQHLRPNNLAMWEAIKWYCRNGYKDFCFGRTEPENAGLRQFKKGWGTDETTIEYFRYDITKNAFVFGYRSGVTKVFKTVFKRMPLLLLRAIGKALYRHVD